MEEPQESFNQFLPSRTSSTLNDVTLQQNNDTDLYSDLSVIWTVPLARRETMETGLVTVKPVNNADLAETLPNSFEDHQSRETFSTTAVVNENNGTVWVTALDIKLPNNGIGQDGLGLPNSDANLNGEEKMNEMPEIQLLDDGRHPANGKD